MRTKKHDRGPRDWPQLNCHRKRAKHQLRIEPFCAFCLQEGRAIPATIADHVEPHRGDWNSFRLGKLQSLCKPHHDRSKRVIELNGFSCDVGVDGLPLDPQHPVYQTPAHQAAIDPPQFRPSFRALKRGLKARARTTVDGGS